MKAKRILIMLAVAMIATVTFAQEFQINRAKYLIENGDYKQAVIILRPLADKGNAEAQYMASQLFAEGKGVVKSTQQAERYLRLSAQNGYAPAMEDYSDAAYEKKDYATAYKWMNAAYDKETTSYRGFCLGYMTYVGQGTQADKKEGWEFMYANLDSEPSRSKKIEEFHTEFYRYLVDSNLNNPVNMRVSLETTYAEQYGKAEWVDEVTDYLFEKLAALPEQQQKEHLKVWQSKLGSYLSVYIYAMMLERGIGTKKSHVTAYYYASMLNTRDLKPYPAMKKGVGSIVANINNVDNTGGDNTVHTVVEVMPEFPGGVQACSHFIAYNLKYPRIAQEQNIQGRVLVQFVINKDGTLSDFNVVRSPDQNLSKEALRVLKLMPIWIPGQQGGKPVRVRFTIPITFQL